MSNPTGPIHSLHDKQVLFSWLVAKLINFAYDNNYEITFGESYRPPLTAGYYASVGKGIKKSLHIQRLAIDINLFKHGLWLQNSEDHKPLGNYWKTLGKPFGVETCWGGDFKSRPDGNHYSIEHEGVR